MRSKAPLLLMEQMVMLLVFALAAALCVQAFVKSDAVSARGEARDHAVLAVQTAADCIRAAGGTADEALEAAGERLNAEVTEGALYLAYDENWQPCEAPAEKGTYAYLLSAYALENDTLGLGSARVQVTDADGDTLFGVETAWQEVAS